MDYASENVRIKSLIRNIPGSKNIPSQSKIKGEILASSYYRPSGRCVPATVKAYYASVSRYCYKDVLGFLKSFSFYWCLVLAQKHGEIPSCAWAYNLRLLLRSLGHSFANVQLIRLRLWSKKRERIKKIFEQAKLECFVLAKMFNIFFSKK